MENFVFVKDLGSGAFGSVGCYLDKSTQQLVAIKRTDPSLNTLPEVNNHVLLSGHINIVGFKQAFVDKGQVCVVMEYVRMGDLFGFMKNHGVFNEKSARFFLRQILDGLEWCHYNKIAHCDIKLDNILVDDYLFVKIADFGYSKSFDSISLSRGGTVPYFAPEVLLNNQQDGTKIDVYACGVCLYTMLHGTYPFAKDSDPETFDCILKKEVTIREDLSEDAKDLIKKMLEKDPNKRISIREAKMHPWMSTSYQDTYSMIMKMIAFRLKQKPVSS